jgi:hypothetical protein
LEGSRNPSNLGAEVLDGGEEVDGEFVVEIYGRPRRAPVTPAESGGPARLCRDIRRKACATGAARAEWR